MVAKSANLLNPRRRPILCTVNAYSEREVRPGMDAFVDFVRRFRERQRENELEERRFRSSRAMNSTTTDSTADERPRRRSSRFARAKAEIFARDPALSVR